MDKLGSFLVTISASAILGTILESFFPEKSFHHALFHVLVSFFIITVFLAPISSLDFKNYEHYFDNLSLHGEAYIMEGKKEAETQKKNYISQHLEAYVEDRGKALGADIKAKVILSRDNQEEIESISIEGPISPYTKKRISADLKEKLGIEEDQQIWFRTP